MHVASFSWSWLPLLLLLLLTSSPRHHVIATASPSPQQPSNTTTTTLAAFCPPPLIPAPPGLGAVGLSPTADPSRRIFCSNGCCLPCPFLNYLYPPSVIDRIWTIFIPVFYGLGTLGALAMLVTHVVIPTRRASPTAPSVISLQIGLVLMGGSLLVIGAPDPKGLQCVNDVERAMGLANYRCFIQGTLLTFGANLAVFYACHLVAIQFLALVFNRGPDFAPLRVPSTAAAAAAAVISDTILAPDPVPDPVSPPQKARPTSTAIGAITWTNPMQPSATRGQHRRQGGLFHATHAGLWLAAAGLTALAAVAPTDAGGGVANGIEAIPGLFCAVARRKAWQTFFGPQAAVLVVALGMQACTTWTVASLSAKKARGIAVQMREGAGEVGEEVRAAGRDWGARRYAVMSQLRLQWRSGLMAVLLLFGWVNLMVLYSVTWLPQDQFQNNNGVWIREWVLCLVKNKPDGHGACAYIPGAWLPNIGGVLASLSFSAMAGVYGMLVYVVRRGILREWKLLLIEQRRRRRRAVRRRRRAAEGGEDASDGEMDGFEDDDDASVEDDGVRVAVLGKKDRTLITIGGRDGLRGMAGVVVVAGGAGSGASTPTGTASPAGGGTPRPSAHIMRGTAPSTANPPAEPSPGVSRISTVPRPHPLATASSPPSPVSSTTTLPTPLAMVRPTSSDGGSSVGGGGGGAGGLGSREGLLLVTTPPPAASQLSPVLESPREAPPRLSRSPSDSRANYRPRASSLSKPTSPLATTFPDDPLSPHLPRRPRSLSNPSRVPRPPDAVPTPAETFRALSAQPHPPPVPAWPAELRVATGATVRSPSGSTASSPATVAPPPSALSSGSGGGSAPGTPTSPRRRTSRPPGPDLSRMPAKPILKKSSVVGAPGGRVAAAAAGVVEA
ncbi:hypothetical protein HDU96_009669 [Phlyctochytrium bullatum]|nr:hypothetical protein HDU96_009669 [Phlyctochytrium bullatum]